MKRLNEKASPAGRPSGAPKSERQRQQELALSRGGARVFEYRCANGEFFAAIALTEAGAFRVLNAERPGLYGECLRSRPAIISDFRVYT